MASRENIRIFFRRSGTPFSLALKNWWAKDPFKESAVIAYYAIFSLPGLLLIVIAIAGYVFGAEAVNHHLATQIATVLGADAAILVQDMIAKASLSKHSAWATAVGVLTMLVGATGVFAQFQRVLNGIWELDPDDADADIWTLVKGRLFSFGLLAAFAFIMLVSFMVTTLLIAMQEWLSYHFSDSLSIVIQIINYILSHAIIAVLFAFMFKLFPEVRVQWKYVWRGALVTAILFLSGMYGMSFYFGKADPGSGYGVAGSIILILLWVSYSSMIVFYGAEYTHAYAVQEYGYEPPRTLEEKSSERSKQAKDILD